MAKFRVFLVVLAIMTMAAMEMNKTKVDAKSINNCNPNYIQTNIDGVDDEPASASDSNKPENDAIVNPKKLNRFNYENDEERNERKHRFEQELASRNNHPGRRFEVESKNLRYSPSEGALSKTPPTGDGINMKAIQNIRQKIWEAFRYYVRDLAEAFAHLSKNLKGVDVEFDGIKAMEKNATNRIDD